MPGFFIISEQICEIVMKKTTWKKIAFIIPWGGELPAYFKLWVTTCKYNPTIDFLIFTDSKTESMMPDNVKIYYKSFDELQELFQRKFDFPISLEQPYKFCDFRPAYGDVFSEYLEGYDFWGHCDMDLFWGDIRKYITDEILSKYDRIYSRGPCCLYRNTAEVNQWYRILPAKGFQDWKEVFQSSESCCFDEWAGHAGGGYFLYHPDK